MDIHIDATKAVLIVVSALGAGLWFFFVLWMRRIEKDIAEKQSKDVCEVRHEKRD